MKLADWRREQGLTQDALASRLGCTISTIARYESGSRDPEPDMKEKIFVLTEGRVEPNDFYPIPAWRRAVQAARAMLTGQAA